MNNENMENYWKSEWALLSVSYNQLKKENRNLKMQYSRLHGKYIELQKKYEILLLVKEDLQKQKK